MPAHAFEADEAVEEGVKIHWLRTIKSIEAGRVEVEVMALDENGRPQPTGEIETLEADDLILALGQDTDTTFLRQLEGIDFQSDGVVVVDSNMMTGHAGVFAGGDMAPSERTVTVAVGHGKKAARHIDAFLQGVAVEPKPIKDVASRSRTWPRSTSSVSGSSPTPRPASKAGFRWTSAQARSARSHRG